MKELARELRKNPTKAEKTLWWHLSQKKLEGFRFRRQRVIGDFIVDFVCLERKLIIELDGFPHRGQKEKDLVRTLSLEYRGYKVLRFWNGDVERNPVTVLDLIRRELGKAPTLPSPAVAEEE